MSQYRCVDLISDETVMQIRQLLKASLPVLNAYKLHRVRTSLYQHGRGSSDSTGGLQDLLPRSLSRCRTSPRTFPRKFPQGSHTRIIFLSAQVIPPAVNPLMGIGDYSATSNNMKLVHWPLMGGLLHMVHMIAGCSTIGEIKKTGFASLIFGPPRRTT